jgi:PIN domain
MALHLIIDSSIYRQNPAKTGPAFDILGKLARAGHINIYVPYVVHEEFKSQYHEIIRAEVNSLVGKISSLRKKIADPNVRAAIEELEKQTKLVIEQIPMQSNEHIESWNAYVNAQVLPLEKEKAASIWGKYFSGNAPFRSIKHRDDLPDALIFEDAIELASRSPLIVLVSDGQLKKSLESIENVTTFDDIKKFVESDLVKPCIEAIEDPVGDIEKFREALFTWEKSENKMLSVAQDMASDSLYGETIHSQQIPDDNSEATIYGYGAPEEVDIEFSEVTYSGGDTFSVPFSFQCDVTITYYIYKPDFYARSNMFESASVSDHNDHYYEIEKAVLVRASGTLWVSIPVRTGEIYDFSTAKVTIGGIDEIELLSSPT